MNVIIIGAGELGASLAAILSKDKHDVVVVDSLGGRLNRLSQQLDIMTIQGDGSSVKVLKNAGIDRCNILIAASGDDACNILGCQVAGFFKVKRTICKLTSTDFFSDQIGFTPDYLGITHVVIPDNECVDKILGVLDMKTVLERIAFTHPDATMTALAVLPDSPINGTSLKSFPETDLINNVRISGIIRDRRLLVPSGETKIQAGDKVYFSGENKHVQRMIEWASPKDSRIKRVIVAGASRIGRKLALKLHEKGYEVRLIEKKSDAAEDFLEKTEADIMVINGNPTDTDILLEAGVENCDAFVSVQIDDEDNILASALARKKGARKTISVSGKAEYLEVVPEIELIDCSLNSNTVAVNTVLLDQTPKEGIQSIGAVLQLINAYVYEFEVRPGSLACGKRIDECRRHVPVIFSLVFRKDKVIVPSAGLVLQEDDIAVIIAESRSAPSITRLFTERGGQA